MRGRGEAAFEVVDQGRLGRHLGKAWVFPHQQVFARIARQLGHRIVGQLAIGEIEQCRLDDDVLKLVHHVLFERIGAFGQGHCLSVVIHVDLLAARDRPKVANVPAESNLCPAIDLSELSGPTDSFHANRPRLPFF
jgi:hypothetical protein